MLEYRSRAGILRARRGASPRTTPDYPHQPLTQSGTAALRERLRERSGALPGVVEGSEKTSAPNIVAFVLQPGYAEGPKEAFLAGGEFAHLDPDGNLHLTLPLELSDEDVVQGWREVYIDA